MSELIKQITTLKNAIAEAEKVTTAKGFKPSAVAKAQQTLHHTATNCWTCGTFAPYDEIAQEQIAAGWIVVQGGKGSEPTNVTCQACAQKSATRPAPKPSAAKKATAKK